MYTKLVLTGGLICTFDEVILDIFEGYGLMIGDTSFNANVTNEAIYLGGNSRIYVPHLGWGFTVTHSIGGTGKGVGDLPPPTPSTRRSSDLGLSGE